MSVVKIDLENMSRSSVQKWKKHI